MCFNPGPERRVPSPNRYIVDAKFCFCKNNKRIIITLSPSVSTNFTISATDFGRGGVAVASALAAWATAVSIVSWAATASGASWAPGRAASASCSTPSILRCEADCLALRDAILEKPAKRQKESTGEYTTPNSTTTPHGDNPAGDAGDATSLTTNEAQKNVQAAAGFRVIMHHTHGLQSRAGSANEEHRKKLPTTPQGQAIYDDLVSKVTTTPRTQPETPSSLRQQTGDIDTPAENDYTPTFHIQPPTPATYGVLVGRESIALTPLEGHFTATPHTDTPKKYRKLRSGSKTKQKQSRPKRH